MKTRYTITRWLAILVFSTFSLSTSTIFAQGTAFTYQGKLTSGANAANGVYDFSFGLFDTNSGGSQKGSAFFTNAVPVTNGYFLVTMDFGDTINGDARWLAMGVKTNGAGNYTILNPRQAITATPYAIVAATSTDPNLARFRVPNTAKTATGAPQVSNGYIVGASVTFGGSGYVTAPPVTIYGPPGVGASMTAVISGGVVVGFVNNVPGSGYPANTTLTMGPPPSNAYQTFPGTNFFTGQNTFIGTLAISSLVMSNCGNLGSYGVALGYQCTNTAPYSVVSGGAQNTASGYYSTVAGGGANTASNGYSTVSGGAFNRATGNSSTVPGGYLNLAAGSYSLAAGQQAKANHDGTFVWADGVGGDFGSTAINQFLIHASGGVGIGTNNPHSVLQVAGTVTAEAFGGNWQSIASAVIAQPNHAYLVNSTTEATVTLPASPAVGDTVRIAGGWIAGWKLAQNPNQCIHVRNLGTNGIGSVWTARASYQYWKSVASSADGTKLVAVADGGQIYTSTDSGVTWTARESNRYWMSVASSMDGTKLVAVVRNGQIYTSSDSGVSWIARESSRYWASVASSLDGTKLVAGVAASGSPIIVPGHIYTSINSGVSWTERIIGGDWLSVASSDDGTKLVAVDHGGQIYTSTESGVSWTPREFDRNWQAVASSADGNKLVAVIYGGEIYASTDSGVSWTPRETSRNWQSVASSADGTRLVAVVSGGQVYTSADAGVNWAAHESNRQWASVASSADGSKLMAVVTSSGQIYVSKASTTIGVAGYITGDPYSALELLYSGNGYFVPLSHEGNLTPY